MKVLFLTRYPLEGASSRYRVFQYIPHLEARGVECVTSSFMSKKMYALTFQKGKYIRKIGHTALAIFQRLKALSAYKSYDIIYMQRELFPFAPVYFEKYLKRKKTKLIFDYDDALFISQKSRFNPVMNFLTPKNKIYDIFECADCVLAGNDYLRDVARDYAPRAETLEVAEDTHRIKLRPPHSNDKRITIGWLGSTSTVKYLELIHDALKRIIRAYPYTDFEIVGGGDFELDGITFSHTAWSLNAELEALNRFDIGIMPLPVQEWSKGKSGGKARTYMAAGIPPVVQKIGYNVDLIKHGETGFLVETEEDWYETITLLLENPNLRQKIGEAARNDVITRFSPNLIAERMHIILEDVLAGREAPKHAV